MSQIDYSVVIRTLGNAGEKYGALLKSISELEPQPKEVIVVLPEGYEKPKEQLGWETFYFSKKGMVSQRMLGIDKVKTEYAFVCDDDITFDSTFIVKLHKPLSTGVLDISTGPLLNYLPQKGVKTIISTIMAASAFTIFHRKRYISILRSTGYSFNRKIEVDDEKYYESQSLPWACFFSKTKTLRGLEFEKESWLETSGYSSLDDQTMFYKAWLMNIKSGIVSNALYNHLDAQTSTVNNKPHVIYSSAYNRTIFWHRFIYLQQKNSFTKAWSRICFSYYKFWQFAWRFLGVLRRRNKMAEFSIFKQACKDARRYINSEEYKKLPSINDTK